MKITNLTPKSVIEIFNGIDYIFNQYLSTESYDKIVASLNPSLLPQFRFHFDKYLIRCNKYEKFYTDTVRIRKRGLLKDGLEKFDNSGNFNEQTYRNNLELLKNKNKRVYNNLNVNNNRDYRFEEPIYFKISFFYVFEYLEDNASPKKIRSVNLEKISKDKIVDTFRLDFIDRMSNHMSKENAVRFFRNSFGTERTLYSCLKHLIFQNF